MTSSARPRLCLLPGLDGTGRLYAPLIAALADVADVDVLAYDSGHFESCVALADALEPALMRHGPVVLVAESFAGPLGVLLAHRHPARVRALVMAATFVHAPLPMSWMAAQLLQRLPMVAPPVFALERWLAGSGLPPPLRVEFETILASLPIGVLRERALAALRVDVRHELAGLRVPLLYLRARQDRLIWRHAGREILRFARHADHVVIDAPHSYSRWRRHRQPRRSSAFSASLTATCQSERAGARTSQRQTMKAATSAMKEEARNAVSPPKRHSWPASSAPITPPTPDDRP